MNGAAHHPAKRENTKASGANEGFEVGRVWQNAIENRKERLTLFAGYGGSLWLVVVENEIRLQGAVKSRGWLPLDCAAVVTACLIVSRRKWFDAVLLAGGEIFSIFSGLLYRLACILDVEVKHGIGPALLPAPKDRWQSPDCSALPAPARTQCVNMGGSARPRGKDRAGTSVLFGARWG